MLKDQGLSEKLCEAGVVGGRVDYHYFSQSHAVYGDFRRMKPDIPSVPPVGAEFALRMLEIAENSGMLRWGWKAGSGLPAGCY